MCGGNDRAARQDFKVNLVAHSMGGLVCRCYLQNICQQGLEGLSRAEKARLRVRQSDIKKNPENDPELSGKKPIEHYVHKVFTYGTPHNGIDLLGINAPNWDFLKLGTFNRDEMATYLNLPKSAKKSGKVNTLNKAFRADHFFCFIGTNYKDYEAFGGLSKKGTGPMSDGLVMCKNAYVQGAARAFAHRAHSGHYGIVNSEEGYQNLRRFLFGQIRVDVLLEVAAVTYPKAIQDLIKEGKKVKASYYIESIAKVRGGNINLHERRVEQASAVRKQDKDLKKGNDVHLLSTFLDKNTLSEERQNGEALTFAFQLGLKAPLYEVDNKFWFDDHFEGEDLFVDTFTISVAFKKNGYEIKHGRRNEDGLGIARHPPDAISKTKDGLEISINFGFKKKADAKLGGDVQGRLVLRPRSA